MLQQYILLSLLTLNVHLFGASDGWKAINFNQAHHSLRREGYSKVDKLRRVLLDVFRTNPWSLIKSFHGNMAVTGRKLLAKALTVRSLSTGEGANGSEKLISHIHNTMDILDIMSESHDIQHSVYKFGQCDRENFWRKYLRKTITMTIPSAAEAPHRFLYLLAKENTINRKLQCVVVKIFTNRLFIFVNSRFPMYYCQGVVHYLMMNSIQRIEVHEFFIRGDFELPANIYFYFYHPNPDY